MIVHPELSVRSGGEIAWAFRKDSPQLKAVIDDYMRYIVDSYFPDDDIDDVNKTMFAFASYNAGPNRIKRLRAAAAERGFDPNVWFRNVEILVAEEVGREPVQYVSNIYKYYVAYRLVLHQQEIRNAVRAKAQRL